jgi:hypothetical protein
MLTVDYSLSKIAALDTSSAVVRDGTWSVNICLRQHTDTLSC